MMVVVFQVTMREGRAQDYFDLAAELRPQLERIAADPKHLGARIGVTAVLHSWGSAMTHHPHVHGIVPGGGISPDGSSWMRCRPGFLLPVRVLAKLFRRGGGAEFPGLRGGGARRSPSTPRQPSGWGWAG